jgi:hypothetical protein
MTLAPTDILHALRVDDPVGNTLVSMSSATLGVPSMSVAI